MADANDGEYPQHDEDRERCGVYQPQRRGPEDLVYEAERHVSGLKDSRKSNRPCRREVLTADVDARLMVQVLVNLLEQCGVRIRRKAIHLASGLLPERPGVFCR